MERGARDPDLDVVELAAERVLQTLNALDARRHTSAPTLERAYVRALESYFEVTERALGRAPGRDEAPHGAQAAGVVPYAVALDEEDDALSDVDREKIEEAHHAHAAIEAHYAAARHAVRLARDYRHDPASSGRRERECVEAVQRHRASIRWLRLQLRRAGEQLALPGLVKTRPAREVKVARSG